MPTDDEEGKLNNMNNVLDTIPNNDYFLVFIYANDKDEALNDLNNILNTIANIQATLRNPLDMPTYKEDKSHTNSINTAETTVHN